MFSSFQIIKQKLLTRSSDMSQREELKLTAPRLCPLKVINNNITSQNLNMNVFLFRRQQQHGGRGSELNSPYNIVNKFHLEVSGPPRQLPSCLAAIAACEEDREEGGEEHGEEAAPLAEDVMVVVLV